MIVNNLSSHSFGLIFQLGKCANFKLNADIKYSHMISGEVFIDPMCVGTTRCKLPYLLMYQQQS